MARVVHIWGFYKFDVPSGFPHNKDCDILEPHFFEMGLRVQGLNSMQGQGCSLLHTTLPAKQTRHESMV